MKQNSWHARGQTALEYAVLISVVIAALLAMQIYLKRSAMGKLRSATDQVGDQFAPVSMNSNFTTTFDSGRRETVSTSGVSNSSITADEVQNRNGFERLEADLNTEGAAGNGKLF